MLLSKKSTLVLVAELSPIGYCKAALGREWRPTPGHILKLVMASPPIGLDMKRKDMPIQQDIFETVEVCVAGEHSLAPWL